MSALEYFVLYTLGHKIIYIKVLILDMSNPDTSVQPKVTSVIKTLSAATIGTTLEWYDFFIAALSATVVWPTVFFPTLQPGLALAASLSSYVVTFISRPIGGYVFGHFGDKLGRKYSFLLTLALMGIASLCMGR